MEEGEGGIRKIGDRGGGGVKSPILGLKLTNWDFLLGEKFCGKLIMGRRVLTGLFRVAKKGAYLHQVLNVCQTIA